MIKRHLTIHLQSAKPNIKVKTFPSLNSEEFQEYLQISPIHFVMTHDGAAKPGQRSTDATAPGDILAKTLLRGMIWWFNTHKLNVALINRIEFRDSKVFTMIVESFTTSTKLRLTRTSKFMQEISHSKALLREGIGNEEDSGAETTLGASISDELTKRYLNFDISESQLLSLHTICAMLNEKNCNIFMASAFLLHSIMSKHLSLSKRRLPLITFDSDFENVIEDFTAKFSFIAKALLDDSEWNDAMEAEEIESDTIDLVDGRLFRAVIQAMCDDTFDGKLPTLAQNDWAAFAGIVKQFANEELSLSGSSQPRSSETKVESLETLSEELVVLPFANPVFDKHLECIHVKTDSSISTKMASLKIYRETSHWHNHRKPLNPKLAPVQKVSKWRYVILWLKQFMAMMWNLRS